MILHLRTFVRFFDLAVRVLLKTRGQIHTKKGTFVRLTNGADGLQTQMDSLSFVGVGCQPFILSIKKRKPFLTSSTLFLLEIFRFPQGIASVLTLRQNRKNEETLSRSISPADPSEPCRVLLRRGPFRERCRG